MPPQISRDALRRPPYPELLVDELGQERVHRNHKTVALLPMLFEMCALMRPLRIVPSSPAVLRHFLRHGTRTALETPCNRAVRVSRLKTSLDQEPLFRC